MTVQRFVVLTFIISLYSFVVLAEARVSRPFYFDVGVQICYGLKCQIQTIASGIRRLPLTEVKSDLFVGEEDFAYQVEGLPIKSKILITHFQSVEQTNSRFSLSTYVNENKEPINATDIFVEENESLNLVTSLSPYLRAKPAEIRLHILIGPTQEAIAKGLRNLQQR